MASKRDQLHAHQFLVQRTVSALVTRETDPEQPPFRRPGTAAFAGIGIAVVAMAAVGVYGLINPGGNDSWRDGQSVIVEEETGTRYVYLDERLHPVENYTSALLAIGDNATTASISRDSLAGVPRGPRIGIPDAPDALPGTDRGSTVPVSSGSCGWTMCSQQEPDDTGTVLPRSVMLVGMQPRADLGKQAVLAYVPETGARYLLMDGYRHEISRTDAVAVSLALRATPAIRVSPSVIEAVPAGKPIAPIAVPDMGKPSTAIPGRPELRNGQLVVVQTSGGSQHYLVEPARLRPITELQYDLQRGFASTAKAYPDAEVTGIVVGLIEVGSAQQTSLPEPAAGDPPTVRPAFAEGGVSATLCLTFDPGTAKPRFTLDPAMPEIDPMMATPRRTDDGVALADQVVVPPGSAAVVEAMPSESAPAGTLTLVTDMGTGYPLADRDVLKVLGYEHVEPVRLPAGLVSRIPMGSGLSHDAAMRRP
jgi:type VII secretion protein EccB